MIKLNYLSLKAQLAARRRTLPDHSIRMGHGKKRDAPHLEDAIGTEQGSFLTKVIF